MALCAIKFINFSRFNGCDFARGPYVRGTALSNDLNFICLNLFNSLINNWIKCFPTLVIQETQNSVHITGIAID
jgi:hypothetical protein